MGVAEDNVARFVLHLIKLGSITAEMGGSPAVDKPFVVRGGCVLVSSGKAPLKRMCCTRSVSSRISRVVDTFLAALGGVLVTFLRSMAKFTTPSFGACVGAAVVLPSASLVASPTGFGRAPPRLAVAIARVKSLFVRHLFFLDPSDGLFYVAQLRVECAEGEMFVLVEWGEVRLPRARAPVEDGGEVCFIIYPRGFGLVLRASRKAFMR